MSASLGFRSRALRAAASLALLAPVASVEAQLAQRVDAVRDGAVQFTYPTREGVCGNGRSMLSYAHGSYYGTVNVVNGVPTEACEPGPARVIITRAGGMTTAIDVFVGPVQPAPSGVTDIGQVPAQQAHEYLLAQANSLDGKPGRDAILPAMIAEGAGASAPLVALARNRSRPLETRRSAISWVGRMSDTPGMESSAAVTALSELARARDDNPSVREAAVSTLARLGQGEGVPALIAMTRGGDDTWLAQEAAQRLATSGDPRARQWLRSVVTASDTPEEVRALAIRGLGGSYATGEDMNLLRQAYGRLTSESGKERVLAQVASLGGRENVQWLLGIARNASEPLTLRRRALLAADKGGATAAELAQLYEGATERDMKMTLIDVYARRADRETTDRLIAIAKGDEDMTVRRRAINRLSSSKDPRAVQALQEIIQR